MQPWQPQQPPPPQPPAWTPAPLPGALPAATADEHDLAALSPFWPKVAAGLAAVAGLCGVLGSLQTWMTVDLYDEWAAAPFVDALFGVALIAVAVKLASARRWAAITSLVLAALLTVTSGVWCIYAVANRLIAVFILLAPVMSVAATGVCAVSIASSDRAERARARLKAQGLELGF